MEKMCLEFDNAIPRKLNRLSKKEYRNTIISLFGNTVFRESTAENAINGLPEDSIENGFENMSFTISIEHITSFHDIANRIASYLINNDQLGTIVGDCYDPDRITETCFDLFLNGFGTKVFRRPMTAIEIKQIKTRFLISESSGKDIIGNSIVYLIQSPQFLYHLENMGNFESRSNILSLTDYEIASRISYYLWQTMPDKILFKLAKENKLKDVKVIEKQVTRMVNDIKAQQTVKNFVNQWLQLNNPIRLNQSMDFFDGLSQVLTGVDALNELHSFIKKIIFEDKGTFSDLLKSRSAFLSNINIARLYGMHHSELGTWQDLPQERRGLLTRAGLLLQSHYSTSPIKRGSFILKQITCQNLHPPDPSEFPPGSFNPPPDDSSLTTRQKWVQKTSPSLCQNCHARINPIGFIMEGFDSLGRNRYEEKVFSPEGQWLHSLPLEIEATPILPGIDLRSVASPAELSEMLASYSKARKCFVKQWYRFSSGNMETQENKCLISYLKNHEHKYNAALLDIIKDAPLHPNFIQRRLVE